MAKLTLENAAEKAHLSANYWGEVERSKKVPSLDTIFAMAKALSIPPHLLLCLDREEDQHSLRRRVDSLLDECTHEQIELVHRIVHAVLEP
jgi:transcriptional regulator with XRE-family HTH domain